MGCILQRVEFQFTFLETCTTTAVLRAASMVSTTLLLALLLIEEKLQIPRHSHGPFGLHPSTGRISVHIFGDVHDDGSSESNIDGLDDVAAACSRFCSSKKSCRFPRHSHGPFGLHHSMGVRVEFPLTFFETCTARFVVACTGARRDVLGLHHRPAQPSTHARTHTRSMWPARALRLLPSGLPPRPLRRSRQGALPPGGPPPSALRVSYHRGVPPLVEGQALS